MTAGPIQAVYDHWNAKDGKWHKHRKLSTDLTQAIHYALEGFGAADIKGAIDNYHAVLQDDNCFWTHKWPLGRFLTVKCGSGKSASDPCKWWQFLDNNFDIAVYATRKNGVKLKRFQIIGKTCGDRGCSLPAEFKTKGEFTNYKCFGHAPKEWQAQFE